jgi:hypothetical protein
MPVIPPYKYKDIRPSLKTGDLFLFYGTSAAGILIEDLESIAGLPPYSHVGMVISDQGNLYFWDAPGGGNTFPDPYASDPNNRIHNMPPQEGCCRVAALDDLLAYYATVVEQPFELRQLSAPVSAEAFAALRLFIDRVDGFGFPTGPGGKNYEEFTGLTANYTAGQEGITLFHGTYFCAQLVADSYMHMGILSMDEWPANSYSPADFVRTDKDLNLVGGLTLGTPTPVEWDPAAQPAAV